MKRFVMLRTIQFHNQPGFMAVKIYNVLVNYLLPEKSDRIIPEKIVP